jgi:DNA invertase Pin-like site-specific DNA recombinase
MTYIVLHTLDDRRGNETEMQMNVQLIAYVRVSTNKQGLSGLGLDAQQTAIETYARQTAGTIAQTYVEVESGKRSDRPQLALAIAHARRIKGRLVIAKLDRLARNVAFISQLMEAKADFVACDNPNANKLTLHILAAIAEHEAEMISARTKAALAAAKARGVQLGSCRNNHWTGNEANRLAGGRKGCETAQRNRLLQSKPITDAVTPIVQTCRAAGETLDAIANKLNDLGHRTVRGGMWSRPQVFRLCRNFTN